MGGQRTGREMRWESLKEGEEETDLIRLRVFLGRNVSEPSEWKHRVRIWSGRAIGVCS